MCALFLGTKLISMCICNTPGVLSITFVLTTVGIQVKNAAEFTRVLDNFNVGDKIMLQIQRNNEAVALSVTLEENKE